MISLSSSAIAAVGYDAASSTLIVEFRGGRTYRHPGVPVAVYLELVNASSPGSYYNAYIRSRY